MDWKEFFRPTIAKIIITIALFIFFVLVPVFHHEACTTEMVGSRCETVYESFFNHPWHNINPIPILIALIVAAYLLSTITVFVYNKIKR